MNKWATDRIKVCSLLSLLIVRSHFSPAIAVYSFLFASLSLLQELIASVGSLEFSGGIAEISHVSKCVGDVSS